MVSLELMTGIEPAYSAWEADIPPLNSIDNLATLQRLSSGVTTVYPPEGGWNVLLRFPDVIDEEELVLTLIHDAGITVQPGYFFDMRVPGFVSLSLLLEPEAFEKAARAILTTINELC